NTPSSSPPVSSLASPSPAAALSSSASLDDRMRADAEVMALVRGQQKISAISERTSFPELKSALAHKGACTEVDVDFDDDDDVKRLPDIAQLVGLEVL